VSREIDRLQTERERLVRSARSERHSWRAIADALGVTRQAAWKAHRTAEAAIDRIRGRSGLSEGEAMALAKEAQHEVRGEHRRG